MNKLFLRIYIQMLLVTLTVCIIGFLAFNQISKLREIEYTKSYLSGITTLISNGLNRHQGEDQIKWFYFASELTGLNMQLIEGNEDIHPYIHIKKIEQNLKHVKFSINKHQSVEFDFEGLNRQLIEGMNRLVTNALRQSEEKLRVVHLKELRSQFKTNIQLISPSELQLTSTEIKQLNFGLVIYRFNQVDGLSALSKFFQADPPLVAQVGPIAPFIPYPIIGILILVLIILISSLIAGWLLIKPFTNRLNKLAEDVEKVATLDDTGNTTLDITISQQGNDAFSTLTQEVDQMANRVVSLVKDQQQLSRSISHEFRTPLVKLGYKIAMLNESNQLSDTHSESLRSNINELHTLVNELLLYSSLEVNTQPDMVFFSLNPLLMALQKELQPLSEAKINIHCPDNYKIFGNKDYWQTILQNLLTNAQRYAHSSITINIVQLHKTLTVTVVDDGSGIKQENLNRIFEPFFVEEQSRNKKMAGHGLGLSIVKRMIQVQNGKITVSNTSLGGAEFKLTFKLD
ncbi:MAG: hypothetical protein HRU38_15910 [Saccharospirillaceae bacterium]|nr:ATP-binding protein [Pseudomonadales bacterium]NRB80127.1 hypothetical protein [Saccharospirillaceae bacterium]